MLTSSCILISWKHILPAPSVNNSGNGYDGMTASLDENLTLSEARLRPSGAQPGHKGATGGDDVPVTVALRRWTLLFSQLSEVICAGTGGGSLQASSDGKGVECQGDVVSVACQCVS